VTPARLVTALITERGICPASRAGLQNLYPERGGRPERGGHPERGAYPERDAHPERGAPT
jgi:hypothetical protein